MAPGAPSSLEKNESREKSEKMTLSSCDPLPPWQAVPASLQLLVRQFEDVNEDGKATDLVRFANSLFEAAWNGTMCESKVERKIPLADAIQRSSAVLDAVANEFVKTFRRTSYDLAGDGFHLAKMKKDNRKAIEVRTNSDS